MSYFQEMYQAAINHDDQKIKDLLAQGACIDERDLNEIFTTVAGKLAAEGKVDEAKHLINKFGAGPEYVVHGCLRAINIKEAEVLIQKYNIDTSSQFFTQLKLGKLFFNYIEHDKNEITQSYLEALAHAGHIKKIYELLRTKPHPTIKMYDTNQCKPKAQILSDSILKHLGHGGHIGYLEQDFAQSKKLPNYIGYEIMGTHYHGGIGFNSMRFASGKLALHTLSFIQNDKFRQNLVKEIKENSLIDKLDVPYIYDIDEIAKKSQTVNTLMRDYELDYEHALYCLAKPNLAETIKTAQLMQVYQLSEDQAKNWLTNPGFRTWFRENHQFKSGNNVFPPEIIKSVDEYLLHSNLKEVVDFHNKIKTVQNEKLKPLNYSSKLFKHAVKNNDDTNMLTSLKSWFKYG